MHTVLNILFICTTGRLSETLDINVSIICPVSWENQQCSFRTGLTQTRLCSHRRWLETENCGIKKKRNCSIRVAKTKTLISLAVIAKLICVFGFVYADCWFSHEAAQLYSHFT